ncbi:hypothetical protein EJ07DRAFT_112012 [Lizonia empirigonia]|nr:hypothetical protein EJ07DRAFT_112012 [Lizonia empirigonia]
MTADKPRPSLDVPNAWVPYRYHPSQVAAIIFVIFTLTTIVHVFQVIKKRTWYFIPMIIGGLCRILSKNDIWALGPFIMQSLLILVAPALFAASIYITLGRVILTVHGERYSLVRQKWLTKTFVAGDVLSFMMQGSAGGGIQAMGTVGGMKLGQKIIIGASSSPCSFLSLGISITA